MKRNIVAVGMLLFFSAALWSCSDSDSSNEQDQNLKESLEVKSQSLTQAVEDISASKGFELISMNGSSTKEGGEEESDDRFSFNKQIGLTDIAGVYEYDLMGEDEATETKMYKKQAFVKTGESEFFVFSLPQEKATNPWYLYEQEDGDAELDNDFEVTATQYNLSTVLNNEGFEFDYLLDADIKIEEEDAGEIFVDWNISSNMNFEYESEFGFGNGYSVGHEFMFGETSEFSYNLKKDDEVLYMEEVEYTRATGETEAEYEYSLTIGNIKIVKNSSSDDYMVYRNGSLEEGAVITIVEDDSETESDDEGEDESGNAFCRGAFDIKITFIDESEVILSDLIGEDTLEQLDDIFSSMHDMYIVKNLIDVVAKDAYNSNMADDTEE